MGISGSHIRVPLAAAFRVLSLIATAAGCDDDSTRPPEVDAGAKEAGVRDGSTGDPEIDAGANCADCSAASACEELQRVTSAAHVTGSVTYPDQPPAGGPHSQCWGNWGVHETELKPERWVHNLEHGGVVLLYHCEDGCEADVDQLRTFVAGHPRTLLTPNASLPKAFAIVAWEHRLVTECLDIEAFERFYAAHFDHAPESIGDPPPAHCSARPDL